VTTFFSGRTGAVSTDRSAAVPAAHALDPSDVSEMCRIRRAGRSGLGLVVVTGCLLLCAPEARGQDVTESSLKAAFIHNFIKFTEWPQDVLPLAAPLMACVLGDASLGDVLENYVKGHPVAGHDIVVSRVAADGIPRSCHLLFVSGVAGKQAAQIVASLKGIPVLTLSDLDEFARVGGMAQLYVEDGRIRFRVNLDTTRRCRLQLSSKILSLATLVKDGPNAITR
jgi:hypothetical protein